MNDARTRSDRVEDWMWPADQRLEMQSSVRDALQMMKEEKLAAVPIATDSGEVAGIVTVGDLAKMVLSTDQLLDSNYPHYDDCFWAVDLIQRRFGSDKVTSVMTENVKSIDVHSTMHDAAKLMAKADVRHLSVTADGKLAGLLAAKDIMLWVASS